MCLLSAMLGVCVVGSDNNVLTQIGFIVLVGLACKNAILIVEFARERVNNGMSAIDAAVEACRLRLRPILMTSFAFIMGVVPLVIASGAGAEMRQALGITVFSGMLGVTAFGLISDARCSSWRSPGAAARRTGNWHPGRAPDVTSGVVFSATMALAVH